MGTSAAKVWPKDGKCSANRSAKMLAKDQLGSAWRWSSVVGDVRLVDYSTLSQHRRIRYIYIQKPNQITTAADAYLTGSEKRMKYMEQGKIR